MKAKWFLALMVFAILALCVNSKCDSDKDIKSGARVSAIAAREFVKELDAEVQSGELDSTTAESLKPSANEIASAADKVANDPRDFNTLTPSERRQIVEDYLFYVTPRADSIEAALHIKNDQKRAKLEKIFQDIQRGLEVARFIEAALPTPDAPTPAPAPTPTP